MELPFFVFNNGVADSTYPEPVDQARLLAELGYDGMEKNGLDGIFLLRDALHAKGLRLYTVYVKVDIDRPEQAWDSRLPEVLEALEGEETMLWLYLPSEKYLPSTAENDAIAVPILQELADLAHLHGIRLMLYPHRWFWLESHEDAIRIARKVNRRNLGMTFNLCHYLSLEAEEGRDPWARLPALAGAMQPYLFALSINGADVRVTDPAHPWKSFIQPLGKGAFDTLRLLRTFVEQGFRGPVGLQCYNIEEPKADHLRFSMQTWREYMQRLAKD